MKLLASLALIGGLAAFRPAASEGQVRVHVNIGAPYYPGLPVRPIPSGWVVSQILPLRFLSRRGRNSSATVPSRAHHRRRTEVLPLPPSLLVTAV